MTDKEKLIAARELYASSPSHAGTWTAPSEGSYCIITACDKVGLSLYGEAMNILRDSAGDGECLVNFNADHTTEEVLAAFDKAIAAV